MFLSKTRSEDLEIHKLSLALLVVASLGAGTCSGADAIWEPAKVVAIEQVSTPAKEPDQSCRTLPHGAVVPAQCRPSALRAEQFWRVTVDVGNKRFVVRPYHAPNLLESFNQGVTEYVDPHLTVASSIEAAIISTKAIRLRSDKGSGIAAIVDSQELLSTTEVVPRPEPVAPPRPQSVARTSAPAQATSALKVVLLDNGDFIDLEAQEIKSQDIGDGAAVYSFNGDSSQIRAGSNKPVLLVMAEGDAATSGNVDLSRLQVGKGTRQLAYSLTKNRSASSIPITVTQSSATVRKINVNDALPPGEYVVLLENSHRGFLFEVR